MLQVEHDRHFRGKLRLVGGGGATTQHLDRTTDGVAALVALSLGHRLLGQVDLGKGGRGGGRGVT